MTKQQTKRLIFYQQLIKKPDEYLHLAVIQSLDRYDFIISFLFFEHQEQQL